MKYLYAAAAIFVFAGCQHIQSQPATQSEAGQSAAIKEVLSVQKDAWNSGDIDGFMDGYWRSHELRFASGGSVTKGWQQTLDRYKKNYSDREKMGILDFTDLEVNQVSHDAAVLHGRWKLTRTDDAPHGLFTLVFRNVDGKWLIVSDTTTSGGS